MALESAVRLRRRLQELHRAGQRRTHPAGKFIDQYLGLVAADRVQGLRRPVRGRRLRNVEGGGAIGVHRAHVHPDDQCPLPKRRVLVSDHSAAFDAA
ncbi:hypothetical protein [Streptomyces sp. NBC_00268]|uniref:hypothetical protein n=1 Tax=Streptomyces sp. NBC_00268 TaxID=2975695 RepID=UPI0022520A96|nr:hypothetical protein [Streptomyces sp. NBC_00268]MCX5181540.1 hypothetical protein [Streptomyces sp. NBC_00268]